MYNVSVPISVPVSKKKRFYLNLNQYRNAHHFTLSKAKTEFHDTVSKLLDHIPVMDRVDLVYTLFVGSNQLVDTNNVCSIVDKFFSDVLVNTGKIPDDNCHIVKDTKFTYGGIDKSNPRVEVAITPRMTIEGNSKQDHNPEVKPMQITLVQTEIEDAIKEYINSQITVNDDQRIEIDLRATRGAEGFQAIIDIVREGAARPTTSAAEAPVIEKAATKAVSVTKPTTSAKKAVTTAKEDTAPDVSEADEDTAQEEEPVEPGTDTTEQAEEAPRKPSLFASATKVVNTPEAE